MKLSEELKHCIEDDACGACQYYSSENHTTCRGLLEKAYEIVKKYEQIKKYEDMFPCMVGDTIYYPVNTQNRIVQFEVTQIQIFKDEIVFFDDSENMYHAEDFGKTVFLTKEQAEAALKKMNEREGEK